MDTPRAADQLGQQQTTERPAVVWEVYDHKGRLFAAFFEADDALKVARYFLTRPGYAQATML
jgi:hypothetical protein